MIIALIILFLLCCILTGLIGFVIHKIWFKPQNNPDKCVVFIEGIDRPYKGNLLFKSHTGYIYLYDHDKAVVFVPSTYKVSFHWYRRSVYLDQSKDLVAVPYGSDKPPVLEQNDKTDLIHELVTSKIGAEAIHAIKSKNSLSGMMIVIIAVAVLVAGGIGYAVHRPGSVLSAPPTAITAPQVTGNNTSPVPSVSPIQKEEGK